MDERERFEAGMRVCREGLGDAHVNRSLARLNASNEEFQDLIARYAWGEIWTLPGFERIRAGGSTGHARPVATIPCDLARPERDEARID